MTDMDYAARMKATGRNDTCPCGSGKKYKRCHLAEDQGKRSAELTALAEAAKAAAEAAAAEEAEDDGKSDAKAGGKSKPAAKRSKDNSGSRGQAGAGKAKNMPRRSAV